MGGDGGPKGRRWVRSFVRPSVFAFLAKTEFLAKTHDVKISEKFFEKIFIRSNDQKYAETYSPTRIFTKKSILKNFLVVALF